MPAPGAALYPGPSLYPSATVTLTWPDVELALCDLLGALGTCGTETLRSLASTLPYIRVTRTGGADDLVTDTATVSIDVFAVNAGDARTTAERVRQRLVFGPFRSGGGFATAHGLIDRVTTVSGPVRLPPTNSGSLRMVVASYSVTMRRQAS